MCSNVCSCSATEKKTKTNYHQAIAQLLVFPLLIFSVKCMLQIFFRKERRQTTRSGQTDLVMGSLSKFIDSLYHQQNTIVYSTYIKLEKVTHSLT